MSWLELSARTRHRWEPLRDNKRRRQRVQRYCLQDYDWRGAATLPVLWSKPALVCQLGRSVTVAEALILPGDKPASASQPARLTASLFGAAKRF
jgi:hypothetical protein